MENLYAQALWDLLQKGANPKDAVAKIHRSLAVRGRGALMPRVGRAFERLAKREAQKTRSVLVVARKSDEARARKESGTTTAEISVDESIIGGWQLYDRGHFRDESWKSALLSIYNNATQK
ncbi:MAG: hypothetical protein WA021_04715 [Minisyncoccia bacterium]